MGTWMAETKTKLHCILANCNCSMAMMQATCSAEVLLRCAQQWEEAKSSDSWQIFQPSINIVLFHFGRFGCFFRFLFLGSSDATFHFRWSFRFPVGLIWFFRSSSFSFRWHCRVDGETLQGGNAVPAETMWVMQWPGGVNHVSTNRL